MVCIEAAPRSEPVRHASVGGGNGDGGGELGLGLGGGEAGREVDGRCRFADATFLVGDRDDTTCSFFFGHEVQPSVGAEAGMVRSMRGGVITCV